MRLARTLESSMVVIAPPVRDREEVLRLFADRFVAAGLAPSADRVVDSLLEREAILSTGIGGGLAVPHAQIPGLGRLLMAASTHPEGLQYPALDDEPVRLVFCLLGDASTAADHLAGLARLARLARRPDTLQPLVDSPDGESFVRELARLEEG